MVRHVALLGIIGVLSGCLHASNNAEGGAIGFAADEDQLFVARGAEGLERRLLTGETNAVDALAGSMDSVDDVALCGDVLFVLDGDDGYVRSARLTLSGEPTWGDPISVPVGPYTGIACALGGPLVVSGGTSETSVFDVDNATPPALSLRVQEKIERGQPDVAMVPGGELALTPTHFSSDGSFGASLVQLSDLTILDQAPLDGAGFTAGGGRPSSWPAQAVVLSSELAYVAHGGGLSELTLSSASLALARTFPVGESVTLAIEGQVAYVAVAEPPSLVSVNLTDGSVTRTETLSEPAVDVAVFSDQVQVALPSAGVLAFPL